MRRSLLPGFYRQSRVRQRGLRGRGVFLALRLGIFTKKLRWRPQRKSLGMKRVTKSEILCAFPGQRPSNRAKRLPVQGNPQRCRDSQTDRVILLHQTLPQEELAGPTLGGGQSRNLTLPVIAPPQRLTRLRHRGQFILVTGP